MNDWTFGVPTGMDYYREMCSEQDRSKAKLAGRAATIRRLYPKVAVLSELYVGAVAENQSLRDENQRLNGELSDAHEDRYLLLQERKHYQALRDALTALMRRLDGHFGGPDRNHDWVEQEQARKALGKDGDA